MIDGGSDVLMERWLMAVQKTGLNPAQWLCVDTVNLFALFYAGLTKAE